MVEKKKRARGRPKSFDENEVLDRAIVLFWAKGFDATSLDDLSAAMGVGRPSLYLAFGDKEGIFLRSLERYVSKICAVPLAALDAESDVQEAVRSYLTKVALYTTSNPEHLGCMLGSVASAVDDKAVREFVFNATSHLTRKVVERLQAAVERGELPDSFPVARRAQRAINTMLAISTRARNGVPVDELLLDAEDGATMVFAPV